MKQVAIVIPAYKSTLSPSEQVALNHLEKYCSHYSWHIVHPVGLAFEYDTTKFNKIALSPDFFKSTETYSRLCLSPEFYQLFSEYKFILIYQLDAYAFSDQLKQWCSKDYSYIGAPWLKLRKISRIVRSINKRLGKSKINYQIPHEPKYKFKRTGNGGFSLRNIQDHLAVLQSNKVNFFKLILKINNPFKGTECPFQIPFLTFLTLFFSCKFKKHNFGTALRRLFQGPEDEYFALYGPILSSTYKICPPTIANKFAIEIEENNHDLVVKLAFNNGEKPFGGHACLREPARDEWLKYFTFIGVNSDKSTTDEPASA